MQIKYEDGQLSNKIEVKVEPNENPLPTVSLDTGNKLIKINRNCPTKDDVNNNNYFNKVTLTVTETGSGGVYSFSFLLNCDYETRHKKF